MASLQKFKLLATQCGVAPSPTRSPRTSPVVHLRRRKTTLRMLLSRTTGRRPPRREESPAQPVLPLNHSAQKEKEKNLTVAPERFTLKDLFVSSPPLEETKERTVGPIRSSGTLGGGLDNWKAGQEWSRPVRTGFRSKLLLRRAWRPVLITIAE